MPDIFWTRVRQLILCLTFGGRGHNFLLTVMVLPLLIYEAVGQCLGNRLFALHRSEIGVRPKKDKILYPQRLRLGCHCISRVFASLIPGAE